jgi:hypothetical protein
LVLARSPLPEFEGGRVLRASSTKVPEPDAAQAAVVTVMKTRDRVEWALLLILMAVGGWIIVYEITRRTIP